MVVLPLVDAHDDPYRAGWCSYGNTISDEPSVELIAGGINTKSPSAFGLWRQGNMMHFGFDLSPDEMNDIGDGLLVNSIAYISRFTEDRPNMRSPSPFAGVSSRSRDSARGFLDRASYPDSFFEGLIDPALLKTIKDRSREGYKRWFDANRSHLRPNENGHLVIDQDAVALDVAFDSREMFDIAIAALAESDAQKRRHGFSLLQRFAPDGPRSADARTWKAWYAQNEPFLFFTEWGGYRWYIDELARKRGVDTNELRGPARADKAAPDQ